MLTLVDWGTGVLLFAVLIIETISLIVRLKQRKDATYRWTNLFKVLLKEKEPQKPQGAGITDAELDRMRQQHEDRKMDRCVEEVAQDMLQQYIRNPNGLIIRKPAVFIITVWPGQTPKYTNDSYQEAITLRFNEIRQEWTDRQWRQKIHGKGTDDTKEAPRADAGERRETESAGAACDRAVRSLVAQHPYIDLNVERRVGPYRYRLQVGDGEVELPRSDSHESRMRALAQYPLTPEDCFEWPVPDNATTEQRAQATSSTLNKLIQHYKRIGFIPNAKQISDGWHTFQELYDMRLALTVSLFHALELQARVAGMHNPIWRSRKHSDGTMFEGMFIIGYHELPGSMITFHYHDEHWDKFDFAETIEAAPEWDGHKDEDVIKRLLTL